MRARVTVTLKPGILDPQGKAIGGALDALGITGIGSVRQGKVFDVELLSDDRAAAEASLRRACEKLLANTVIENFRVELDPGPNGAARGGPRRQDGAPPEAAAHAEMPAEGPP